MSYRAIGPIITNCYRPHFHSLAILREIGDATATRLPWSEHKFRPWIIVDAKGEAVCSVDVSDPDKRNIASMIIVAVNTCGGFKAEIAT